MYGFRLTSVILSPNPSGPTDETATVILLRKTNDEKVLGAIWHYTCHPTAVVPDNAISADYPGAVRRALRERFGEIPCIFIQGFCGDIRPNMETSPQAALARACWPVSSATIVSGPMFASTSAEDWMRWSSNLAAGVADIARRGPVKNISPAGPVIGSARIPLEAFFAGSTPDKMLEAQIVRLGEELEIVALSAEPSVEWQGIFDQAFPVAPGRIGFTPGTWAPCSAISRPPRRFRKEATRSADFSRFSVCPAVSNSARIGTAVIGCVNRAFDDLQARAS